MWHDHTSIAGHGYYLVLVSVIYDEAIFYTSEEMRSLKGIQMNVPAIVEKPEVHIFARSSSSLGDQLMFVEARRECLKEIRQRITAADGTEFQDIVRFFYGDGPAAQFESGHKLGGNYPCVGCGAHSGRFTDIAYCYRAPKPTLQERQEFVLQGKAWKQSGKSFSDLVVVFIVITI